MPTAQELIKNLNLIRHPEGGWFCETYRSAEEMPGSALPERFGGSRSFSTAIYFLLEQDDISTLHRIKSDEIWHFYAGSSVRIHAIYPDGRYQALRLGADLSAGERFCAVVPSSCWFGAEVIGNTYALVGCTVAPGFDFEDFELAERSKLTSLFPQHSELIRRMTRA